MSRLLVALLLAVAGLAQDLGVLDPVQDAPKQMLRAWLERIALEQLAARRKQVEQIRTREQFEARRAEIRRTLLRIIGGLPAQRRPLNLRCTGRLDRGDYRVEKVVFESLPKFYVTANLYVPQQGRPPYPAVLHPVGHSLSAKNRAFYQSLSIGLAKQGFVVLTYDPIGQGERRIFYDAELRDSKVGSSTMEHSMVGIQSLLAGESVARYRIWDGMRGIDLLSSLPEVDAKRIGVTGCSGGGTLTVYLAALDERVRAAAPSCYVTSWEEQLEGTGPQDAEQQFPDQLRAGIDHADLVTLAAPKPYLICSSTEDFFPLGGARRTYEAVRRLYTLFGAKDKIQWFHEPGPHGIRQAGREAVYAWMNRWLRDDPRPVTEPRFQTEYEEDLNATASGQVATSLGGETASTLNIKRFAAIAPARPLSRDALRDSILRLTRYAPPSGPLNLGSRGEIERDGYRLERLVFETEPGRVVPALLAVPGSAGPRKAAIYVDERGKSAAAAPGGNVDQLARMGYAVLALDPVGVGETASDWGGYAPGWFGQDKVTWLALMVGRPLVGLRMADLVRGLDVLAERRLLPEGCALGYARGRLGVDLLHAAALDARFSSVVLEESLVSYGAIARAPIHRQVFEVVIPGVLGSYDLPDLAAALAPRPVTLVNARSPLGTPLPRREVEAEYGAAARVRLRREDEPLADLLPKLR